MSSAGEGPEGDLPQIDFATFVLSLNHSALVQLGQAPDPVTGTVSSNPALAKQTIDLLAVLQDKTKGNLDGQEERILDQVLYELRMLYVKSTGG